MGQRWCSGSYLSLPIVSIPGSTTTASLVFSANTTSAVMGSALTVCMDVTTGSGGTLTNFSVVGSAGSLHVVDGHSLSPLGFGVPAVAGTTTLQVSGTGLTALDVVILVPQVSSGTATCLNVGGKCSPRIQC